MALEPFQSLGCTPGSSGITNIFSHVSRPSGTQPESLKPLQRLLANKGTQYGPTVGLVLGAWGHPRGGMFTYSRENPVGIPAEPQISSRPLFNLDTPTHGEFEVSLHELCAQPSSLRAGGLFKLTAGRDSFHNPGVWGHSHVRCEENRGPQHVRAYFSL